MKFVHVLLSLGLCLLKLLLVVLIELLCDEFEELFLSLELIIASLHLSDEPSLGQLRVNDIVDLAEAALVDLLLEEEAVIDHVGILAFVLLIVLLLNFLDLVTAIVHIWW